MDEETPKHSDGFVDEDIDRRLDPAPAEESLSEALSGLEQILEQRRHPSPKATHPNAEPPATTHTDAQYTIPLLHDVVVPGAEEPSPPTGEHGRGEMLQAELEDEDLHRKLSERLANEIEVIVQARMETAIQEAAEDIREQVRNHLEIMLPEIIEELNVLGRRQDD